MAAGLLIIQLGRPVGEKTGGKERGKQEVSDVTQMLHVYMHVWCIFCVYTYIYIYFVYVCIFIDTYMHMIVSVYIFFNNIINVCYIFLFYPHERVNYRCKSIRSRILLDLIWIGVNKICQFSLSFALKKIEVTD